MSNAIDKCLKELSQMTTEELHSNNRRLRLHLAATEWELAVSLLASYRQGLHQRLGHSSVTDYATKKLNLAPQKTMELVSTARAMESLPSLSEKFRAGELSWCKVRELKRVATPETEQIWVDYALGHTTHQIQRKVACSPKEWKRNRALNASLSGQPNTSALAVEQIVTDEPSLRFDDSIGAVPEGADPEENLPAPKFIRVEFLLTPEQYAVYEEAESRVRARKNQRLPRAAVLAELARSEIDRGASRERARFQVMLHANEDGQAWFETQRGVLPAPPAVLEEALNQWKEPLTTGGRSLTSTCKSTAADNKNSTSTCKSGRRDIPNWLQRAVFARAGNRCECCGRRGGRLEIHHLKAVSDGGGNTLEDLRVLCKPCHAVIHKMDFELRADWSRARALALQQRRGP